MALDVSANRLVTDLRTLVLEMEGLLQEGGNKLKERLGDAGAGLESHLEHAKKRLLQLEREAYGNVAHTARSVHRYARRNPWQLGAASLVTGLVLGVAIGMAIASRDG